jgi:hypothetical protein
MKKYTSTKNAWYFFVPMERFAVFLFPNFKLPAPALHNSTLLQLYNHSAD